MKLFALIAASSLFAAPVSAYDLNSDPFNHDPLGSTGTYNQGGDTVLRSNDITRNSIYASTIRDNRTGDLYDCNNIGMSNSRW